MQRTRATHHLHCLSHTRAMAANCSMFNLVPPTAHISEFALALLQNCTVSCLWSLSNRWVGFSRIFIYLNPSARTLDYSLCWIVCRPFPTQFVRHSWFVCVLLAADFLHTDLARRSHLDIRVHPDLCGRSYLLQRSIASLESSTPDICSQTVYHFLIFPLPFSVTSHICSS